MELTKKQKIILIIATIIVALLGAYYIYTRDKETKNNEENLDAIVNSEITEDESSEEKKESQYSDSTIMVHVSGAVNQEGIVELKEKSRIADAIDKAGGLKDNAYIEKINLAYVLEDGMKIHIPNVNEKTESQNLSTDISNNVEEYVTKNSGIQIENINNTTRVDSSSQSSNKKININKATQSELETLPGIGASTAQKIITYRNEKGKFNKIEDIKNVKGIGDSKYNNIKELITIK